MPLVRDFSILVAASLLAQLVYFLLFRAIHQLAQRNASFTADAVAAHTSRAARLFFLLLPVSIVEPQRSMPLWLALLLRHVLEIGYIVVIAWFAIVLLESLARESRTAFLTTFRTTWPPADGLLRCCCSARSRPD